VALPAPAAGIPAPYERLREPPEGPSRAAALQPDLWWWLPTGLILLPRRGWNYPRLWPVINSHASLLARAGAAPRPIHARSHGAGMRKAGDCDCRMEAGLDTGPMLLKTITPISPEDYGCSLHDRLATARLGGALVQP